MLCTLTVLQRVHNQVIENPAELVGVGFHHERLRVTIHDKLDVPLLGLQLEAGGQLVEHRRHVEALCVHLGGCLAGLGVLKEVFNQHLHLLRLQVCRMDVLLHVVLRMVLFVLNQAQVTDD